MIDSTEDRLEPGDRVKFAGDRCRYTVQAVTFDRRYAICTRPFVGTVLYTVVDFAEGARGPDDLVFSRSYEDGDAIEWTRQGFEDGRIRVSRRHRVPLDIERIERIEARA